MNQSIFKKRKRKKISKQLHISIQIDIEKEEEKENIPSRRKSYQFALPNYESCLDQGDQVDAWRKKIMLSIEGGKKPWILFSR